MQIRYINYIKKFFDNETYLHYSNLLNFAKFIIASNIDNESEMNNAKVFLGKI